MLSKEDKIAELKEAVLAQNKVRHILGDEVVNLTIASLQAHIEELQKPDTDTEGLPSPLDLKQVYSHLPKWLAEKMHTTGQMEGERKQVTVLFADISGFTSLSERLDPEELAALTNDMLKDLAEAVYQYEGYVDKFIGDAVMAVFGAPVTHEDDAERALRAALEMRERFEGFNRRWINILMKPLSVHIGVNTGIVIAGGVGSDLRMSYTVLGDTVNTASRLQDAAEPGQILVSRHTYRQARAAFEFLVGESIRVKGKREPLAVYELRGARLTPEKTRGLSNMNPAFVGREREIDQLRGVMNGLEIGEGQLVLISGEAGIGKSRLLTEWHAEIKGSVHWVEGRCLAYTRAVPYGPFLDLIRRHAGIREDQSESAARWRLDVIGQRFFPGNTEAHAILANLLALPLTPQEQDLVENLSADGSRNRLFEPLEAFFSQLAQDGPTVLLIEDMHWIDTSSLELLAHLLPLVKKWPLAIVGVSRQHLHESSLIQAMKQYPDRLKTIQVSSLNAKASVEMVGRLLSLYELPKVLNQLILQKSDGNPFFVEEMIRALMDRGALEKQDGKWVTTPLIETVTVPGTLQGLLMARLDRLPAETKWLAQQASVIGRFFLFRVLFHLAKGEERVKTDLARMEQDELIREWTNTPELEYMFQHALTQEVAYESMLTTRRKDLHRQVGTAMEMIFAERLPEFYTIIGEHFLKGEAWEQAFNFLLKAGEAAMGIYAYAEARVHYSHALDTLQHLPATESNHLKRADTLVKQTAASWLLDPIPENLGRLEEAKRIVEHAQQGASSGDNQRRLIHIYSWMIRLHTLRYEMDEAIACHRHVMALGEALDEPELVGIASLTIGITWVAQGYFGKVTTLASQAIPALEKTGNWTEWIRASVYHGVLIAQMGDCEEGIGEVNKGLEKAREIKSSNAIALSYVALAIAYFTSSCFADSIEAAKQAIEVAQQSGDQIYAYLGYGFRGWAECRSGQLEGALDSLTRAQGIADKVGTGFMGDWIASARAELAFCMANYEEALTLAQATVEMSQKMGGILGEGLARRVWGQALAALGQMEKASAQLDESLNLLEAGSARLEIAFTLIAQGKVLQYQGKYADAREKWMKAAEQFKLSEIKNELDKANILLTNLQNIEPPFNVTNSPVFLESV